MPDPVADLSAVIAQQPENGALLIRRASLNRQSGDIESALADLEMAASLPSSAKLANFRAGQLLFELKRYPDAIAKFDQALALEPDQVSSRRMKAQALWHVGRLRESTTIFESLMATPEKAGPEPYLTFATLLVDAKPPRLAQAIQVLERGMAQLGPTPFLVEPAMNIEIRRKRWSHALEYVDAVIANVSRKDYWLSRRGEILDKAGRRCEALAAYQAALTSIEALPLDVRRTPTFEQAQITLASLVKSSDHSTCSIQQKHAAPRRL